jgi:putative ABC transport system permease protein
LILTGTTSYTHLTGGLGDLDFVNLGLIRVKPGTDLRATANALNDRLGPGVHVWTRADIEKHEQDFWVESTSVGIIFKCGVGVALLVGIVFVYQVISGDIASRLKEFATLKAIGYSDFYLSYTIIQQAVLLALFGYVPGLVLSMVLYRVAATSAGIPIGFLGEATVDVLERCALVLLLTVGLCMVSGLFALGKLKAADPADLF